MAVLTKIPEEKLREVLRSNYNDLVYISKISGILEGVENTNYKIETFDDLYIFTLIERRLKLAGLQRCMDLLEHLADIGIPCPIPSRNGSAKTAGEFFGKPGCVVSFLSGQSIGDVVGLWVGQRAKNLGAICARIHQVKNLDNPMPPNQLGKAGILALADTLQGKFGENAELVNGVIAALKQADFSQLETGLCHGDLFPDNVFFEEKGDAVSGVIDWYFACTDTLAYDLAIVLSAWCFHPAGDKFDTDVAKEIIDGYNSVRELSDSERAALPLLCQLAALRFYLTRLQDSLTPRGGALIDKDPNEYANKLRFFSTWPGI
ncbi:MAG: phosphotransferase [Alphaproteobacteria bacterium]|jgi:homoserine kinase type II|nr:phosphotransferase [Alphaproteobacteria bacterium]